MGVTAQQIEKVLRAVGGYGGQGWSMSTLAREANEAMQGSGITTREGVAAFLTQCMIESDHFRVTEEYHGSSTSYAPYFGRGFIQCTFKANYASFGRWCKARGLIGNANEFVNRPSLLAADKWKWLTAVWYLSTRHNLIGLCNQGKIDEVGAGVHAGDPNLVHSWYPSQANTQNALYQRNRFDKNRRYYRAFLAAGVTAPGPAAFRYDPPEGSWTTRRIQRNVFVNDDGVYGEATRDAVKKAQKKLGVAADGLWGEKTQRAMKKAQRAGDYPKPKKAKPKKKGFDPGLTVDGKAGPATIKALQRFLAVDRDGKIGPETAKAMQRWLKVKVDGDVGPATVRALQRKVGAKVDGQWGATTTRHLQRFLNRH